jgi:hypothetical protein
LKRYRTLQADLHQCQIFPIGEEPSGLGWTGFQAMRDGEGYFLVFREGHRERRIGLQTWLKPGEKVRCESLLGQGENFSAIVDDSSCLTFTLHAPFQYALYHYLIE